MTERTEIISQEIGDRVVITRARRTSVYETVVAAWTSVTPEGLVLVIGNPDPKPTFGAGAHIRLTPDQAEALAAQLISAATAVRAAGPGTTPADT